MKRSKHRNKMPSKRSESVRTSPNKRSRRKTTLSRLGSRQSSSRESLFNSSPIKEEPLESASVTSPNVSLIEHLKSDGVQLNSTLTCFLCLRECTAGQVMQFADAHQDWNSLSSREGQKVLEKLLGLALEFDPCTSFCKTCWAVLELFNDFRECCLTVTECRKRFISGGLRTDQDDDDDEYGWLSCKTRETIVRAKRNIRDHVERLKQEETMQCSMIAEKSADEDVEFRDADCHVELLEVEPMLSDDGDGLNWGSNDECEQRTEEGESIEGASTDKNLTSENDKLNTTPAAPEPSNTETESTEKKSKGSQHRKRKRKNVSLEDALKDIENELAEDHIENVKLLTCEKCDRKFDSRTGYSHHVQFCIVAGKSAPRPPQHSCPICSVDFSHAFLLRAHLNKHKGVKPYKCRRDNCDKYFYGSQDRYSHEKYCGTNKLICSHCGVQLASASSLASHLATHGGENKYPCEICGKKFKLKERLRKHMLAHSDVRNFPCQVCGKAFKTKSIAKVHMRTHTLEKPFSCNICGQSFAYKSLLQPHVKRAHGGDG